MQNQTTLPATPVHGIVPLPFTPYYVDDSVTIYNKDWRKVLPWLGTFDLLLTDPPYGLGEKLRGGKTGMMGGCFNEMVDLGWDKKPEAWEVQMMVKAAKDYIVWGGNYFCEALQSRQCVLVWDKMNGTNPMADCEIAMTSLDMGAKMFSRHHFSKGCRGKVHPTQKPLPLIQWCLSLVKDAATVIDPFAGSGTTGVACKLEGRKAVLIEISEEYCEKAAKRLSQGTLF
jgi:site-specific DNA-methyltransferase (adenine-specific)